MMGQSKNHLKYLLQDQQRLTACSLAGGGLFYDYSRQRVVPDTLALLYNLAAGQKVKTRFNEMITGGIVNPTEGRAALHTACRRFDDQSVLVKGHDVMPEIRAIREAVRRFCENVHTETVMGSTGKRFAHVVVVGIGGSYLGPEFVAKALQNSADKGIQLHFLSNVDIDNFGAVVSAIDPETTLWVVISKSYTTVETLANAKQAARFMRDKGLDPMQHLVTVTAKGSPGDDPNNPALASFNMFDFIGGRYSVSSAVGAVPLSLYLGYDCFERFLKGAEEMDRHASSATAETNVPLTAALISIWNYNFLGYCAHAIIPYSSVLSRLVAHIQQLSMESNGKSVTAAGVPLEVAAGVPIFGEPGTNAQHSFFQLAHQGRSFPIDFIGALRPQYDTFDLRSRGVTNHEELWANLISQPKALAIGKDDKNAARRFDGNRPSSTIVLADLSPESIGRLLAFYEHRTVLEAFLLGINPFDQFGVELGKTMAGGIRNQIVDSEPAGTADDDPIAGFYLDMLRQGRLPI
jgi:glucose-6-phosphate isomerase